METIILNKKSVPEVATFGLDTTSQAGAPLLDD